ncbi:DNA topoisomerase IV subunit A [Dechloromonas sp.]|uniref:DNA topoisomerase IV subunit A n=1 Tax=Dechloromonas sp. TaxID=1917218 RepID=UPI00120F81B1|nr:DNA topoisomerase IV subunit A [Dechloromonas sp.]MBU3697883.1 DNA topoisomerase IV subunit A [Dechloromonas sp.]TEX49959.1 MAG: DNA topoisomerase IV subunit A [Rhodocyclaceae bacterium]
MTDQLNLFDPNAEKKAASAEADTTVAPPDTTHSEAPGEILARPVADDSSDEMTPAGTAPPALPPAASSPADDIPPPADYAARRYLEYAMSVVTGRALPSNADGQKPVQRRILYAMHRMGLYRSPKHVKSARVVGDVIGKYHPHGDSSVYDAMVRMAQDWSLRYPVVDGQGNFGSRDGDNAAAMRYTETRLTPIAELLLAELDEGTVDWKPNYDGVNDEPCLLPARLPFCLLNGASGIAVGMATEIPSHNLREVAAAAVALIRNPETSEDEVLRLVPGPDYPGGAQIISSPEEIAATYKTGRGSLRVRAKWKIEPLARGQWRLVITELPPGVSTATVMSEIEACSNPVAKEKAGKKVFTPEQLNLKAAFLSAIGEGGVRDESGKEHDVRLVIEPASSRQGQDDLVRLLLAHTSLETNASINLTILGLAGAPRQGTLYDMIAEWCRFRLTTVERRTRHRLSAAEKRIHILEGRLAVLLDIDQVIKVIRESDDPKADLIAAFNLSEIQAEDILEIRLRQLARLEGIKIGEELAKLRAEADGLRKLLDSESELRAGVAEEIEADAKKYGDDRRTLIEADAKVTQAGAKSISIPDEPTTLIVSKHGWLRSRSGHNVDPTQLSFRSGDSLLACLPCRTVDHLILIDNKGRAYSISAADLPGGKGDGVPATSLADFQDDGKTVLACAVAAEKIYLVAGEGGYGFRVKGEDFISRGKAGKAFLTLDDGELPAIFQPAPATGEIGVFTKDGRALVFVIDEIRQLPKGRGLKLIDAAPGKTALEVIEPVIDGIAGKLKGDKLENCRGNRGGKGKPVKVPRK